MKQDKNEIMNCPWCYSHSVQNVLTLEDYFLTHETFEIKKCQGCGLLYTTPKPNQKIIGDYYKSESYLSHKNDKKSLIAWLYSFIKNFNLKYKYKVSTENLNCGNLLDIGCGIGDFATFAQKKGWAVFGIEPSGDARKIAEQNLGKNILKPDEILQLNDSSFDLITMWHVLEHVDDLHSQVQNLYRLLKPNGRLVIALPNHNSYDAKHYGKYWAAYDVPRHLYHFDRNSLLNIINDTSIKFKKTYPLKWDSFYVSLLSEKYKSSKIPFFKAFFIGLLSNIYAKTTKEYSSLIYIFEKKIN